MEQGLFHTYGTRPLGEAGLEEACIEEACFEEACVDEAFFGEAYIEEACLEEACHGVCLEDVCQRGLLPGRTYYIYIYIFIIHRTHHFAGGCCLFHTCSIPVPYLFHTTSFWEEPVDCVA